MKKLIKKNQYGGLTEIKDQSDYDLWLALSPEEKRLRKINIAQSYLLSGPNITNFYNAAKAMLGGFNPKNPNIQGGIAPTPGLPITKATNAAEALQIVKAMKAQKAAKTGKKVEKTVEIAKSELSPIDWYNLYNLKKASRINLDNLLNRLSDTEKTEILKVMQSNPQRYLYWDDGISTINPTRAAATIRNIRKGLLGKNYTSLQGSTVPIRQNVGISNVSKNTNVSQSDYIITKRGGSTWSPKKESGGKIHNTFVKGVSVIDTNQDAYKHVKKRLQKRKGGTN